MAADKAHSAGGLFKDSRIQVNTQATMNTTEMNMDNIPAVIPSPAARSGQM